MKDLNGHRKGTKLTKGCGGHAAPSNSSSRSEPKTRPAATPAQKHVSAVLEMKRVPLTALGSRPQPAVAAQPSDRCSTPPAQRVNSLKLANVASRYGWNPLDRENDRVVRELMTM